MRSTPILAASILALTLAACGGDDAAKTPNTGSNYPKTNKDAREDDRGRLGRNNGGGGFTLFGGSDSGKAAPSIGVNAFLWRATLDTLSFLPLASADPFGGTIITDWYEDPQAPGERYKVNAVILDRDLRADAIRVTLFKQAKNPNGQWGDRTVTPRMERDLEDTILTRARQLRVQSLGH